MPHRQHARAAEDDKLLAPRHERGTKGQDQFDHRWAYMVQGASYTKNPEKVDSGTRGDSPKSKEKSAETFAINLHSMFVVIDSVELCQFCVEVRRLSDRLSDESKSSQGRVNVELVAKLCGFSVDSVSN